MAKLQDHKAAPYIITDFETGGFDLTKQGVTEISMTAIRGDSFEEIGKYEALIAPYGLDYDQIAFDKTGISLKLLNKEGKSIERVVEEVVVFLEKANIHNSKTGNKPILVGHNPSFENMCFQAIFSHVKRLKDLEKLFQGSHDYHGNFQITFIDTIHLARMIWAANPRVKSFNLEAVCEQAGIAQADGHRASADVLPTMEFFKQTIRNMRTVEIGGGSKEQVQGSSFRDGFAFEM